MESQEELIQLLVAGVGAGMKGTVTGYLRNILPGVTEDIAAIAAGGLIWHFGGRYHKLLKAFGAGILIAGIGQMTKGMIPAVGAPAPAPAPQTAQSDQLANLARMQSGIVSTHS